MTTCQARPDRFEPASMHCAACRLQWDVNDPEPPVCIANALERRPAYVSALAPDPWGRAPR